MAKPVCNNATLECSFGASPANLVIIDPLRPSIGNMKVGNIGRLDPDLKEQGITGLIHGAKMEEEVWNEFYGNPEYLAYESERLIAEFAKQSIEQSTNIAVEDLPQSIEREMIVRQRVNQSFFRSAVMSAYNFQC